MCIAVSLNLAECGQEGEPCHYLSHVPWQSPSLSCASVSPLNPKGEAGMNGPHKTKLQASRGPCHDCQLLSPQT